MIASIEYGANWGIYRSVKQHFWVAGSRARFVSAMWADYHLLASLSLLPPPGPNSEQPSDHVCCSHKRISFLNVRKSCALTSITFTHSITPVRYQFWILSCWLLSVSENWFINYCLKHFNQPLMENYSLLLTLELILGNKSEY